MKRKIPCLLPGIVARTIINSSTANYDVIRCASLSDMPNYRHDKMTQLIRSEAAMMARTKEREKALARCVKPYTKQNKSID